MTSPQPFTPTLRLDISNCYLPVDSSSAPLSVKVGDYELYQHLQAPKTVFGQAGTLHGGVSTMQPIALNSTAGPDYLLIAFIAALALFVAIWTRYRNHLRDFYESLIYRFISDKIANDVDVPRKNLIFLLDLTLGLFVGFYSVNTIGRFNLLDNLRWSPLLLFAVVLLAYTFYRLYGLLICWGIRAVVDNKKFVNRLQFDGRVSYALMGFSLLPFTFLIRYNPPIISKYLYFIVLSILIITIIYRFFRFLSLFLKNGVSILYFILYLCALEILPILLILKVV